MDPIWGYQAINVEAQEQDTSSLLHWTRNMIALRKLFQVFGRGSLEFLKPENRKVLAYIREFDSATESQRVVCVANLSRFAQPVTLDLSRFAGMVPVEMLGYVPFPKIDKTPYAITLGPYAFLWLELQDAVVAEAETTPQDIPSPEVTIPADDIDGMLNGAGAQLLLESFLPRYLIGQRWFGAKSRTIKNLSILDAVPLSANDAAILIVHIEYTDGPADDYTLPIAIAKGDGAENILASTPEAVIANLQGTAGAAVLIDGLYVPEVRDALVNLITGNSEVLTRQNGTVRGEKSSAFANVRGTDPAPSRKGSAEQSNSSILYGKQLILKLFRRLQPGENPDAEIGRFLTEVAQFTHIAPFAGEILLTREGEAEPTTLGLMQGLVSNTGDGWEWTLREIERLKTVPPNDLLAVAADYIGAAKLLGQRTGEMHAALATPTDNPAFAPEPTTNTRLADDAARLERQIAAATGAIKARFATLHDDLLAPAAALLADRGTLLRIAEDLPNLPPSGAGQRTRIHGDYHLGQVLRTEGEMQADTQGDFVLLDFEGEPARSLDERRAKQSPLKDVAGMLRSFSYAGAAGFGTSPEFAAARSLWESAVAQSFLSGYNAAMAAAPHAGPADPAIATQLLDAYLLEKALYELVYEVNNRPDWIAIPLSGILDLLKRFRAAIGDNGGTRP